MLDSDFSKYLGLVSGIIGIAAVILNLIYKIFKRPIRKRLKKYNKKLSRFWRSLAETPRTYKWHNSLQEKLNKTFGEQIFSKKSFKAARLHTIIILLILGLFIFSTALITGKPTVMSWGQLAYYSIIVFPGSLFIFNVIFDFFTINLNRLFIRKMVSSSLLNIILLTILCILISCAGAFFAILLRILYGKLLVTYIFKTLSLNLEMISFQIFASAITSLTTMIYMFGYLVFYSLSNVINGIIKLLSLPDKNSDVMREPLTLIALIGFIFLLIIFYLLLT
ncbi:hypothetical protein QQ020_26005 [Fulvivirgaceae bacterium BMA12]|uniref:Uncharacterized protein n=1 Tax=Agaribacillus aureus TaxID=3051825 RepID=A0ABT8LD57_9BACT|nr:hypothetical protein [Fulvivirgaceae bacterium BMA12]